MPELMIFTDLDSGVFIFLDKTNYGRDIMNQKTSKCSICGKEKEGFRYRCPLASKCRIHKRCHVLKTVEQLKSDIKVLVKCPAQNNEEIVVDIGSAAM